MNIKVGTRKSRLAVIQTQIVVKKLQAYYPEDTFTLIGYSTRGDENLNKSLSAFGSKGVFIKELETALLKGEIDFAVHSAKDVPQNLPSGLEIGAVTKRNSPADVLVSRECLRLCDMKMGAVIGTGSARRGAQLKEMNPGIMIKDIRGNIDTRLEKLKRGGYDAIMLAKAAVNRLYSEGIEGFFVEEFSPQVFTPAAGQGILAVEIANPQMKEYLSPVHDERTMACWEAECTFLQSIGGGCSDPSGAYAWHEHGKLCLATMVYQNGKMKREYREIKLKGCE